MEDEDSTVELESVRKQGWNQLVGQRVLGFVVVQKHGFLFLTAFLKRLYHRLRRKLRRLLVQYEVPVFDIYVDSKPSATRATPSWASNSTSAS